MLMSRVFFLNAFLFASNLIVNAQSLSEEACAYSDDDSAVYSYGYDDDIPWGGATCTEPLCPIPADWTGDPCVDVRFEGNVSTAFRAAIATLKDYYAFWDWKGLTSETLYDTVKSDVERADTTGDVRDTRLAGRKFVAAIADAHVDRGEIESTCGNTSSAADTANKYDAIGGSFGFVTARLDNGDVVVVKASDSLLSLGVTLGDKVLAVDGVKTVEFVEALGAAAWMWSERNAATTANRAVEAYRALPRGPVGMSRVWKFAPGAKCEKLPETAAHNCPPSSYELTLVAVDDGYEMWDSTEPRHPFCNDEDDNDDEAVLLTRTLPSGLGYMGTKAEGSGLGPDVEETFHVALESISDAPGLVFDLRGNRGGDDPQAPIFLSFFQPDDAADLELYEKASYGNRFLNYSRHGALQGCLTDDDPDDYSVIDSMTLYTPGKPTEFDRWGKPVVALINSRCESTCEGLAMGFAQIAQKYPSLVQVVGFDGTAGSFGMSGGTIVMPGDFTVSFPYGRSLDVNENIQLDSDVSLVGGVLPTTTLPRNLTTTLAFARGNPYATGEDIELDLAVAVLQNMINVISER